MMNKLAVTVAAVLVAATPALAQVAPSEISPGMQVYDGQSHLVGAVSKVANGMATVVTDKYSVPVNPASFALDHGKLFLSMDRAALNNFYETNVLAAEASLAIGKPVKGTEGSVLGTIKSIDDTTVVITLTAGQDIQLPRNGVVGGANGAVAGISAAALAKQLDTAATPPATAVSSAAPDAKVTASTAASTGTSAH